MRDAPIQITESGIVVAIDGALDIVDALNEANAQLPSDFDPYEVDPVTGNYRLIDEIYFNPRQRTNRAIKGFRKIGEGVLDITVDQLTGKTLRNLGATVDVLQRYEFTEQRLDDAKKTGGALK